MRSVWTWPPRNSETRLMKSFSTREHLQSAHHHHRHTVVVPIILLGLNQKLQYARLMSYWSIGQTNSQHAWLLVLIYLARQEPSICEERTAISKFQTGIGREGRNEFSCLVALHPLEHAFPLLRALCSKIYFERRRGPSRPHFLIDRTTYPRATSLVLQ